MQLGTGEKTCPLCVQGDAEPDVSNHGLCLMRQALGGIGTVLDPEGQVNDPDAGLTPRQSALALGILCKRINPDELVSGSWAPLEMRRRVMDTLHHGFRLDIEVLTALMPHMRAVLGVVGLWDDDEDEIADDAKPEAAPEAPEPVGAEA